jgi:hypothetical protein
MIYALDFGFLADITNLGNSMVIMQSTSWFSGGHALRK